jgi:hypothetical protein
MSRGTKVVLNYAPQTDVATKPTTNWKNLPYTSESLDHKVELTDSETIVDSRIKTAGIPTKASVEGDVQVEFAKTAFDDLMEAAAGNLWATNKLIFGGNVQKMFAIEKVFGDVALYHYFKGMRVNTFKLEIPEQGFIGATFGFTGQGYETGTTAYSATPAATSMAQKASSITVGDIKINGSSLKGVACATSFSFELNNNIDSVPCLGGGLYPQNLLEMMADITGSMTLEYATVAQGYLNNQITGTPIAIEATINTPDGSSYVLTIPKAQVSGSLPTGGKDRAKAELSYTVIADVAADAPYITRTLKP